MLFSRQLTQFFATIKYGSYTKAADEIAITPSALSHGIKELENGIGKKLLNRHKSGVSLTAEGRFLYNEMFEMYNHGTRVFLQLKGNKSVKGKVIRIKTDGIFQPQLTNNLDSILTEFPGEISFVKGESNGLLHSLECGECDVAIESCVEVTENRHPSLYRLTMTPEKIGIIINDDISKNYKTVDEILKDKILVQSSSMLAHPISTLFQLNMDKCNILYSFVGLPELQDTYSVVSRGLGVSLAAKSEISNKLVRENNFHFIENPFSFYPYIYRNIYLNRERLDELADVVLYLQGEKSK